MNYNIGPFHEGRRKELAVILGLTLNSVKHYEDKEGLKEDGRDKSCGEIKF